MSRHTAHSLLQLFFPNGEHKSHGAIAPEKLIDAQARIAAQYGKWMKELDSLPGQAEAYRDAVLAFETAADLGARDHMTIYGITAKDTELAGAGLEAFLGFFDQRFRDHDYDVGSRTKNDTERPRTRRRTVRWVPSTTQGAISI